MSNRIGRILVYTHNSIGLGHLFRTLAIITGMRKWLPGADFLVLSGTSVPHILLSHGIEVIKLPGIKKAIDDNGCTLQPRYLHGKTTDDVIGLRKTIITETFDFFKPHAVMVEHYLTGLSGEISSLLGKKESCRGKENEFILINLSRGIMGEGAAQERPCSLLYDFMYVFDNEPPAGEELNLSGGDSETVPVIRHLGGITDKNRDELPAREEVLARFRLPDRPIILISLSRHGEIVSLIRALAGSFARTGLMQSFQIIMVIDPYLDHHIPDSLRSDRLFRDIRLLPFFYPLIDLIHAADLVICRAGYNTINELLLTDTKAVVIPEHHPGREQEKRAALVPRENIVVLSESDILASPPDDIILELIGRAVTPLGFSFDKYTIGRKIVTDFEDWSRHRGAGAIP